MLQELMCFMAIMLIISSVIIQIWVINNLRKELTHIRTITALIAEKSGVMVRLQCPECENRFWEDATSKRAVCSYCKAEFRIEEEDVITKKNEIHFSN